jgi:hypothetical protein
MTADLRIFNRIALLVDNILARFEFISLILVNRPDRVVILPGQVGRLAGPVESVLFGLLVADIVHDFSVLFILN